VVTPKKILIVDDDEDGAASLGLLLEVSRHEVAVRYDGQSALECLDKLRPDVAFLDLSMPELDGYELCRRIRSKPWGHEPYLFALTGWTHVESEVLSAGFDGCLLKPCSLTELQALLANPASRSKRARGDRRGPAGVLPAKRDSVEKA
jgi:two-component system, chemotaxis family, CheB/CheR fusion protein